ncbi:hypothetical protein QVD17_35818 [Tagetes erecta]|uniref:Sororin C-terminal region domain-containing protein n=1 Tax=Tagetes erecta TaxID=13708 RepID=A0AAD8NHK0_TARER|nr:hypothetical protein QVD17_35818 [Tagetes erecta]
MLTRSSIQRKLFSNHTTHHSASFSQSNNPISSIDPYMFDSSLRLLDLDVCVGDGDGDHMICSRKPTFGLEFKDNDKAVVVCSTPVNLFKKRNEKNGFCAVKKAKGSSCQPLLRSWSEVEEAEHDLSQTKSPDKERKRSPKGRFKRFVALQDFIDQQKAYFKEIDAYELDVEEVD